MSPKDRKIIEANPNIAPYDLLTTHGLSKGGFDELVAMNDKQVDNMLKAGTPRLVADISKSIPAMPRIMPHLQASEGEQVRLRSKNGTGQGALIDKRQAIKLTTKYPNDYEIG